VRELNAPPSWTPPTSPWTPLNWTPLLQLPAADAPERCQPVLILNATAVG